MSTDEKQSSSGDGGATVFIAIAGFIALCFFALPAAVLLFGFSALAKRRKPLAGVCVVVGLGIFWALSLAPIKAEIPKLRRDVKARSWEKIFAHAPRFWLWTLPLAPAFGLAWDVLRPRTVAEKLAQQEQEQAEREARRERKQWREADKSMKKGKQDDGKLGAIVSMTHDLADFQRKGNNLYLQLTSSVANLHGLILGGSGAGKTGTIKRIAYIFASQTDYDIMFFDPKPTPELQLYFAGLMTQFNRPCKIYPDDPFNGFRGDTKSLYNRFMTIPSFGDVSSGATQYYREMTELLVRSAVGAGETPPQSFDEVAERLDFDFLTTYYASDEAIAKKLGKLSAKDANSITMRFDNIAAKLDTFSGDGWAFEDVRAAYFGLPVLESARDVDAIARYLIEDLKHYFSARKDPRRRTVIIFDEFSAIGADNIVNLMEMVRGYGGIVILASQTADGLGNAQLQSRILGNVTVYLQRMNDPRSVAELGGVQQVLDVSRRVGDGQPNKDGLARMVDKAVIDATKVAQLPTGGMYIINRGRVAQIKVQEAPALDWDAISKKDFDIAVQWHNLHNPDAPITIRKVKPLAPAKKQPPALVSRQSQPASDPDVAYQRNAIGQPEPASNAYTGSTQRLDIDEPVTNAEDTSQPKKDDFI